jgi:putative oxidoreductase
MILFVSRLLVAWIFVHEGVYLVMNFGSASAGMAKTGVPAPPLVATIALQLIAGIAIAIGWHARPGAAALGLFCIATAIMFHGNTDSRNELLQFEKALAIAGGMFGLVLNGAVSWSVERVWRTKREEQAPKPRRNVLGNASGSSVALDAPAPQK